MKLFDIQVGIHQSPLRTMIYGVHGIGKSTFAAFSPSPVFIQTEDGLATIGAPRFPVAETLADVIDAIGTLYAEQHDYKTVVVDSLDWLERLIHTRVCEQRSVSSIEDIGYGKGYVFALIHWRDVLSGLDALQKRGMNVILCAHAQIEKFANPETDTYDRYSPKLHKLASALVQEWSDDVLFAMYQVITRKVDEGFDKKRTIPIGEGERIIRTSERPAHVAKNRHRLPPEMPLDFQTYAATCGVAMQTTKGE